MLKQMFMAVFAAVVVMASAPAHAATLMCEGDSQTATRPTYGVYDTDTWCAKVAAALGWSHVNYAVGGSKSADVVSRIGAELAAAPSDTQCVAVMIGANDAWIDPATYNSTLGNPPEVTAPVAPPAVTMATYDANLVSIVNAIQTAGKTPLLVTPWAEWSTSELVNFPFYVRKMQDVGARLNVPVIDAYHISHDLYWNLKVTDLMADYYTTGSGGYQHPNGAGHSKIAGLFAQERYSAACAYAP